MRTTESMLIKLFLLRLLLWSVVAFTSPLYIETPGRCRFGSSFGRPRPPFSLQAEPKKSGLTLGELRDKMKRNPAKYEKELLQENADAKRKKNKYKRTRQRVAQPKQQYVYAAQKRQGNATSYGNETTASEVHPTVMATSEFGLYAAAQHVDAGLEEPAILGRICVNANESVAFSDAYAYIIQKPAGWSIVGGTSSGSSMSSSSSISSNSQHVQSRSSRQIKDRSNYARQLQIQEPDGSVDVLEYNELDIMALLTPEELEEYEQELLLEGEKKKSRIVSVRLEEDDTDDDDDDDDFEVESDDENEMKDAVQEAVARDEHEEGNLEDVENMRPQTVENLKRISARLTQSSDRAAFALNTRPSLVGWLKDNAAAQGTPIRGGNHWTALAGATDVDDSGLVVLCPKKAVDSIFVEATEYYAVVGTGGYLAPKSKVVKPSNLADDAMVMDIVAKLRKGRGDDPVQTVQITIPEGSSTCSSIVEPCQNKFQQGIRGDPMAHPLDRRARRRLIHCNSLTVSSLVVDEVMQSEATFLPDDVSVLLERKESAKYTGGSFRGRHGLRDSSTTNAFREVNGAADGFPGWTVDRYDKWLFVQHDPAFPRGPLPSIHDGNTAGVYYLHTISDRSAMGSEESQRPVLLEGKAAPSLFPVKENGVVYMVSLDSDLSTGIFLDQRPQRAWLTKNCCEQTRVLNCFAHTGAFSVAAASAGASTVSLDLSKKWLDRLPEHFSANGIPFDEKHDAIYGDCFDWLVRLAKRGEKYDIVILDPPSSSVGGKKKKRWSIKNDMDELVSLAAGLVKEGGLLWTTTNSASIGSVKFARLCKKGLEASGVDSFKLERIQPMPPDFPTVGSQPVKNLVWRL